MSDKRYHSKSHIFLIVSCIHPWPLHFLIQVKVVIIESHSFHICYKQLIVPVPAQRVYCLDWHFLIRILTLPDSIRGKRPSETQTAFQFKVGVCSNIPSTWKCRIGIRHLTTCSNNLCLSSLWNPLLNFLNSFTLLQTFRGDQGRQVQVWLALTYSVSFPSLAKTSFRST